MAAEQNITTVECNAIRLGAVAVAAHLDFLRISDERQADDKALRRAGRRADQACAELAALRVTSPAACRAKAAALLTQTDMTAAGEPASGNPGAALAFSLARDVLGDEFDAALAQLHPPAADTAAAPSAKLAKLYEFARPLGSKWLRNVLAENSVDRLRDLPESTVDRLLAVAA